MPNVVGKNINDAKKQLEDSKLVVEIEYDEDEGKTNGTVLSQSYPQNSVLKEGDLVKLTVNRRVISKPITVEGIPEGTSRNDIVVSVSVDGGVSNTYSFSYDNEKGQISFTVSGYEKYSYTVTISGSLFNSGGASF